VRTQDVLTAITESFAYHHENSCPMQKKTLPSVQHKLLNTGLQLPIPYCSCKASFGNGKEVTIQSSDPHSLLVPQVTHIWTGEGEGCNRDDIPGIAPNGRR